MPADVKLYPRAKDRGRSGSLWSVFSISSWPSSLAAIKFLVWAGLDPVLGFAILLAEPLLRDAQCLRPEFRAEGGLDRTGRLIDPDDRDLPPQYPEDQGLLRQGERPGDLAVIEKTKYGAGHPLRNDALCRDRELIGPRVPGWGIAILSPSENYFARAAPSLCGHCYGNQGGSSPASP